MYLISLKKSEETITVLNYGNADLKQHLSNLTKKYNISLINNTLENKRNFSNELIYILSYLKFFIKHLYILMSLLKKSEKLYFFTPFLVPLISSIRKKDQNKICYQPLPGLIKRRYINHAGEYTDISSTNLNENFLRRFLIRIAFGKHLEQRNIGSSKITAIKESHIKKIIQNNNKIDFSLKDYENYQTNIYPTLLVNFNKKNETEKIIYFEQHYVERNLVDKSKYINLLEKISKVCELRSIKLYAKPHPGMKLPDFYKNINNVEPLEAETPAEFFIDKDTTCISTSSGAMGSKLCSLNLSLVFLMPFHDDTYRQNALRSLGDKINKPTYTPSNINDLDILLSGQKNFNNINKKIDFIKPK